MIKKIFLTFFMVQMVTYLTTIIGNLIDGIVTGKFLGTDALAAYGLCTPFLTIMSAIAMALSVGTSTLLSTKLGRGETDEMKRSFRVCFWFILIAAAVIAAAIFVCADPIATALGAEGEVHKMAVDYMRGYSIGLPPIFIITLSMPVLQLIGKRKILILSTVVLSGVNVLGDFANVLLVHGGMFGMAIATSFSFYVSFVIVILTVSSKSSMLSLKPAKPDSSILKEMAVYGAPNAVSLGSKNVQGMLLNSLVLSIAGMHMVAAFASINSAMNIAMSIGGGMSSAVSVLIGIFSGEKDKQDLREVMKFSAIYSVIFNGICIVIYIVFSGFIVSLFLKDKSLMAEAEAGLRIVILAAIFMSFNYCLRSYYQAMKMRISILFAIINGLVCTTGIALVLGNIIGIMGVWLAFPLGELLTLLIFGIYALHKKKKAEGVSILERIMMIPEEYDNEEEPVEIAVRSMDEVFDAADKVRSHMKELGEEDRISAYTALAVEELGGNIISYGFSDDRKPHHLSIKIKKFSGKWILRLRDDCRGFDPVDYVKSITPEDEYSHIGIRMIYGLADEVRYLNTLHLNNLIISFKASESK